MKILIAYDDSKCMEAAPADFVLIALSIILPIAIVEATKIFARCKFATCI